MKRILLALAFMLGSFPAYAQFGNTTGWVTTTCGTISPTYKAGNPGPFTVDVNGNLCINSSVSVTIGNISTSATIVGPLSGGAVLVTGTVYGSGSGGSGANPVSASIITGNGLQFGTTTNPIYTSASIVGTPTVTGSVYTLQVTSPWIISGSIYRLGTGTITGTVYQGGNNAWTVSPTVNTPVTQITSPWVVTGTVYAGGLTLASTVSASIITGNGQQFGTNANPIVVSSTIAGPLSGGGLIVTVSNTNANIASGSPVTIVSNAVVNTITGTVYPDASFVSGKPIASLVSGTTAAMTGTTSTQLLKAVSSTIVYLMNIDCTNSSSTGTLVTLQDGSGGANIGTVTAAPSYGGHAVHATFPVTWTSSGNGLYVANVTTSASVICTGSGFRQ